MSDSPHLCLSDLLDQDLSSQEYFYTLPTEVRQELMQNDEITTFEALQVYAARLLVPPNEQ